MCVAHFSIVDLWVLKPHRRENVRVVCLGMKHARAEVAPAYKKQPPEAMGQILSLMGIMQIGLKSHLPSTLAPHSAKEKTKCE